LGSGAIMTEVLEAAALLEAAGVLVDVWSVTSYNALVREAEEVERQNLLAPAQPRTPTHVERCLAGERGVFVAASDYMRAWPGRIARWVPGPFVVLGTDGFGLSESRPALRAHFEVDARAIAHAAASALVRSGAADAALAERFSARAP
jgi:pyruvate dehydrogenase E1 component